jgi:hypothetical protein
MNPNERLAARLMRGARDLVWQDVPAVPRAAAAPLSPAVPVQPVPNPMAERLMAVVMQRPTAYSALADALAALADIPMDEATRYRSSFAVLKKTQQRTVEQVGQAIDVHLGDLESEQLRFSSQSRGAEDERVAGRLAEVAELDEAIAAGAREIETLRAQTEERVRRIGEDCAAREQRASALRQEAEQQKQAMTQTVRDFDAASESVRRTLLDTKAKVQQYLGQS